MAATFGGFENYMNMKRRAEYLCDGVAVLFGDFGKGLRRIHWLWFEAPGRAAFVESLCDSTSI